MRTNLNKVRQVAKQFLYLTAEPTEVLGGMLVSHPFLDTRMVFNPNTQEFFDMFDEPEKYSKFLAEYSEVLDGYSLVKIFLSIRKPYKLVFFKHVKDFLSEKAYAEYLMECYTMTEMTSDTTNVAKRELLSYFRKADKQYLMDKEELGVLDLLPDKVTIYRGVRDEKYAREMSWTLSLEKAEWFANRYDADGYVFSCVIDKKDILCYTDARGEQEVIVDVNKLKKYEIEEVA